MNGCGARRLTAALLATAGYLATIPTANWLTTRYPAAPVAPGVLAPAGVYVVGLTLVNYGFPIAQLAMLPQAYVPVIPIGSR